MAIDAAHVVGPLVGGAIGFASALFVEPLRRHLFRPKIILTFGAGAGFQARTPEDITIDRPSRAVLVRGYQQAEYIRVKVENVSTHLAKGCQAYLTNVERQDANGAFRATEYCDTIPLPWSCRGDKPYDAIDIPPNVPIFFDVASVREGHDRIRLHTLVVPFRYAKLTAEIATYRLTVQVSGEEFEPKTLRLRAVWDGAWDNVKTRFESTE